MKKLILGSSPVSSILGYVLAGLLAYQEYVANPNHASGWAWVIPVLIAVLGRIVGDSNKKSIMSRSQEEDNETVNPDNPQFPKDKY